MKKTTYTTFRFATLLLLSTFFVAGCSNSNNAANQTTDSGGADGGMDNSEQEMNEGADTGGQKEEVDPNVLVGPLQSTQANLELVGDKTFRINWEAAQGAEFYRVLENPDGVSGFNQISDDLDSQTQAYDHRVALYSRVGAQYIVQACDASSCLDSEAVLVSGTLESAIAYLKSSYPDRDDRLGGSISISADGSLLAVGATGESSAARGVNENQDDNSANESGAVYVFARVDGEWLEQAYLKASNADEGDEFGDVVSLSADGSTIAVGSFKERSSASGINGDQTLNDVRFSGAVYVFKKNNGSWEQEAYLKSDNSQVNTSFGRHVSLSTDGNTLAVSATQGICAASVGNANGSEAVTGVVYVFDRSNDAWQQQACLEAGAPSEEAIFGWAIDISGSGNTLAVGSASSTVPGSVYLFERSNGLWEQQDHLKADVLSLHGSVGKSVSLSADGNMLALGASDENSASTGINGDQNNNSAQESGAAYVFVRNDASWQQQAYVKASNTYELDQFGYTVALSADGKRLAVYARTERSSATGINGDQAHMGNVDNPGAVYVFVLDTEGWRQQAYIKSPNAQISQGSRLDFNADGTTLAIGASSDSGSKNSISDVQDATRFSGAVYLY